MKITTQFFVLCFILQFSLEPTFAQPDFAKVYYQEFQEMQSGAVAACFDGSFVIAGERDKQYFLLKIDETGDTLWNRSILGKENYLGYLNIQLIALRDSSLLFTASYLNPDSVKKLDVLCVNLDVDGNVMWSKTYDFAESSSPQSVAQTFDDGFILSGRQNAKILVLKLDKLGDVLWSKLLEGGNYVHSIKQTSDTGYLITGNIIDQEPYFVSAFLMKLKPNGNIEWSKSFKGASNFNDGLDVIEDNGYVMAMWSHDSTVLVKTDLSGEILWTKRYLPTIYNEPLDPFAKLQKTTEGRIAFLASIISFQGESNVLMELNDVGEVLWASAMDMYAVDMLKTDDKGFLVVGNGPVSSTKSPLSFEPQIGVIKTDSLGQNAAYCINDITIEAIVDTVTAQSVEFVSETLEVNTGQPLLQMVSEPLTIRSGCVESTGVDENNVNHYIRVFPNPSSGIFTVQITNGEQISSLEVFNAFGERIFQLERIKSTEALVDLSTCPSGMYFLQSTISYKKYTQKIMLY
jgi:hypothetical protein